MYTNKLKVALGTMLSAVSIASIGSFVVACQNPTDKWDTTITINNAWVNDGFLKKIDENGKVVSEGELSNKFLQLLGERFNELKIKMKKLKNLKMLNLK
uniref:Lipoprotein n=1 Tax=Mycoplasma feriruminatoris TaxID=1179777 RepID=A0A654IGY4_9MOLU|nr:hypothetical protein MF5293_00179 [Mycoplasma feriruminatoris]